MIIKKCQVNIKLEFEIKVLLSKFFLHNFRSMFYLFFFSIQLELFLFYKFEKLVV
jgi:hypothetical protein